jgi:hypothetical protein
MFGVNYSAFATVEHAKHREARGFESVLLGGECEPARRLQPVVEERVRACIQRLRSSSESNDVLRLVVVVSPFANDKSKSFRNSPGC